MYNVKIGRDSCLVIGTLRVDYKGCFRIGVSFNGEVETFSNVELTKAQAMAVCAIAARNGLTPRVFKSLPKRSAFRHYDNGELFARAAAVLNK